ncbi:putative repeat protein (TIGR01451 family) [Streptosporangium becharense]|uniref:Putative repeat protein (TIGR01451 family) n=2 Tax=Streptosporangium becharense TaxID=1816182 RepID=A0A7W9ILC8_9ACTN|nr:putative repeat protein (TIGR01451 family) [Streptosporangium becharense]
MLSAVVVGSLAPPTSAIAASAPAPSQKSAEEPPELQLTHLGALNTPDGNLGKINSKGQVAGYVWNAGTGVNNAVLFSGGSSVDIHAALGNPGRGSIAEDVSDDGTVVGRVAAQGGEPYADTFIYKDGKATRLGLLYGTSINNRGQVAGFGWIRDPDGSILRLEAFPDQFIDAYALNESGSVVGIADMDPDPATKKLRAFRTEPNETINLSRDFLSGDATYQETQAFDVNNRNQVAGYVKKADGGEIPAIWEDNDELHLQNTPHGGIVYAINDADVGAGVMFAADGARRAALYVGGKGIDLTDMVRAAGHDVTLRGATGINDLGQIAVVGRYGNTTGDHAFLLDLKLGKPRIESFDLETRLYPSTNWVPVPEKGTVEGNKVRATVTLHNPNVIPVYRTLEVVEDGTGKVVRNGRFGLTIPAGETVTKQVAWDTEGLAWRNGEPYSNRSVTARVLNGVQDESKDTKPIVIRPMPVALVHGWRSGAHTWGKYETFLKAAHPLLRGSAISTFVTGFNEAPQTMTYPLPLNASMLGEAVEYMRQFENAWRVNIVAHSMGGTISREYIARGMGQVEDKPVVNQLIEMGTPNQGSPCADMIVQWANGANVGVPWYPATWENTTEFMQEEFNPKTKNLKGVRVSNLVGNGYPLLCGTNVKGKPVPEPPGTPVDSDLFVPTWSARGDLTDTPTMKIRHTSMTGSQEAFNDYVKPRLASLLAGGSEDVPGLRGTAPTTGDKKAKTKATAAAAGAGDADSMFAFPEVTVEAGKTAIVPLDVPQGTAFGVIAALPETVGLLLRDPAGQPAAQYAAGSEEAKEVVQGLNVAAPQAGAWKLEITNTGAEPVQAALAAWVAGNPVTVTATTAVAEDGKATVTAAVVDGEQPVTGVPVRATLTLGDGTRKELTLKDDGNSGDGATDDGTYGVVTDELADGAYPVTVLAETAKGVRTTLAAVKVAKPDTREFELTLSAGPGGSVSASPAQEKYRAGTEVTLTATPEAGRILIGWVIDGQERGPGALTVVMDGPHTVQARFGSYTVTELGALPGYTADQTEPVALNDHGQVAATVGRGDDRRAVRWQDGVFTDLGGLSCEGSGKARCPSGATDINEAGDVAGWAEKWQNDVLREHAVVYRGGSVTDLHSSDDASTSSAAVGLNDTGQVLGRIGKWDGSDGYHWIWNGREFRRLPDTPLYTSSVGGGRINDRGMAAGAYVKEQDPSGKATGWGPAVHHDGVTTPLEIPECTREGGVAHDVNAGGLAVGEAMCDTDGKLTTHAYTWQDGRRTDLGEGRAYAVNDHGLVAGFTGQQNDTPVVWLQERRYNLQDLLPLPACAEGAVPCMRLISVADVNSSGQILARGFIKDGTGSQGERAYLLTPSAPRADLEVTHKVSSAEFGPGASVTWTSTVTNKGPDTATGVQLDMVVPAFSGGVCETSRGLCTPFKSGGGFRNTVKVLEPGGSATVTVTATIPAGAGDGVEVKTSATAHTLDVTDPARGNNRAEATATVRHALNRTAITFDPVRVGTSSAYPTEVKLTNRSSDPMKITAIKTEGPFTQTNDCPAAGATLEAGKTCLMWVSFAPTQVGAASGKLTVTTGGDQPSYVTTLTGQGKESNAVPQVDTPAGPLTGVVGQPFTLTVPFSDGDPADTHTAEVWWGVELGDFEPTSKVEVTPKAEGGGGTVTVTGTFRAPSEGVAAVMVTDSKGDTGYSDGIRYVIAAAPAANTAPVAAAGTDVELTVNEKLQRVVPVSDPGSASWTASVDYGDGTGPVAVTAQGAQITLEHRWASAGRYPVVVTVRDNGGLQTSVVFTATVVTGQTPNQAPEVTLSGPGKVTEGTAWKASGSLSDPGSKAWTATVDYGDGTGPRVLPVDGTRLKLEHVFTDDGERTVTVTVTDDRGATGTARLKVKAAGAAPEVKLEEPAADTVAAVGVPVTLKASFTDPGTADTHTGTWTVDGHKVAGALAGHEGKGSTIGTHTFTKPGRYPVTVTVTDDDGASTTAKKAHVLVLARAGSLSGEGQVASPAGSCRLSAACEAAGKAAFAVTAGYPSQGGAPTGELRYDAPGFTLRHTAYTVLAAADGTATLRGTGRVNDTTEVTFEITASDPHTDRFRLRAWGKDGGLVYDNQRTGPAPSVTGTVRVSGRD